MAPLPDRPFLTAPFDTDGGGIDFLGMRQVNLSVFLEQLIPGVNNVAGDFGNFCLGAWIPWKFRRLASKSTYTPAAYRRFREAVEVAVAFAARDGSPADERFTPRPWARIGANSLPRLPGRLTFASCRPKRNISLYAPAQLGPSLKYLRLLEPSGALTAGGVASDIAVACEDADSITIAEAVDAALSASPHSAALFTLHPSEMTANQLDDLGLHGLHPGYHRRLGADVKRAFLRKLFAPDPPGEARRRTAALVLGTAAQTPIEEVEDLRRCWYTGLLPSGERLTLDDPALAEHRWKWAVFHARQIQRTAVEVLLRCFELAVAAGCRTVPAVVSHWQDRSPAAAADGLFVGTLGELVRSEAGASPSTALLETARKWGEQIHGDHPDYDDEGEGDEDGELLRALRLVARWWLRTAPCEADGVLPGWFREGGGTKVGMGWFRGWLAARWDRPVVDVLRDAFADLVFSQHIKVALTRFDGKLQRLRFTLGDGGIVRCAEVPADKFGGRPSRMVDRLGAFTRMLADLDVVRWDADDRLRAGSLATEADAPPRGKRS